MKLKQMTLVTAAGLTLASCSLLPSPEPTASVGEGWQLIWQDEFSKKHIDTDKWSWETNCWGGGNNEQQCYTDRPENSFIRDGKLVIKAFPETFTGPAEPLPLDRNGEGIAQATLPYTSARLRTITKGDFTYGRIEVRAKIPGGQGIWPAIWMLPTDWVYGGWAASGEIDIMEAVNLSNDAPKEVHGTLHYGREWPGNAYSGTSYIFTGSDPTQNFHTYAIEWAEGEIRWYVDDVHYATQRQSGWYSQAKDENGKYYNVEGAAPFNQAFHLLLNVAVGGNWPGNPNETTQFPVEMEVDYVRVFECPTAPASLITCATKNPRATRVFGNQPPEIIDIDIDPELTNADIVDVYSDYAHDPFRLGIYTANGEVQTSEVVEEGRGNVTRIAYNTDESVVYFQAPVGLDFSEFAAVEFDLKVTADPRASGGLIMKVDCFHPCSSGEVKIESPELNTWTTYRITTEALKNNPGSSIDLSNVNTPFVISPDWGNQKGVVLLVDNVRFVR